MQLPHFPALRGGKNGAAGHRGFFVWLFGFIVCYQVVYQAIMYSALHQEEAADACLKDSTSSQCAEVQLFRVWQAASSDFEKVIEQTFAGETDEHLYQLSVQEIDADNQSAQTKAPHEGFTGGTVQDYSKSVKTSESKPQIQSSTGGTSKTTVGPIVISQIKRVAWGNITPWAQSVIDLQAKLETRMQSLQSVRSKSPSGTPPASTSVQGSNITAWGRGLAALQARLESQMSNLRSVRKRMSKTMAPSKHDRPLLERIMELGREVCLDPQRRGRAACAQFLNASAQENQTASVALDIDHFNARFKEMRRSHDAWERSFSEQILALGSEWCKDPKRKGYTTCGKFLSIGINNSNGESTRAPSPERAGQAVSVRGAPDHGQIGKLHWKRVTEWKVHHTGARQVQAFNREDLLSLQWSGRIPKAACIAVLPLGKISKLVLTNFIDNFRMQSYEGARQLILVYHYKHLEAAQLVRLYADGFFIKAVAAFEMDYPSAASFRFGAWSAKADVVARWDFAAWHHAERLSMQVRALALAGRPACLLDRWSVRGQDGALRTTPESSNGDASIIGETEWMHSHWYPLLDEWRVALEAGKDRNIVYVSMPELTVYAESTNEPVPPLQVLKPSDEANSSKLATSVYQ